MVKLGRLRKSTDSGESYHGLKLQAPEQRGRQNFISESFTLGKLQAR